MLANRRLARHIADAGFAEIRHQLSYKTIWNGGRLLVADHLPGQLGVEGGPDQAGGERGQLVIGDLRREPVRLGR